MEEIIPRPSPDAGVDPGGDMAAARATGRKEIVSERYRMLALSRTEGQSIIINGNIEVKVVKWSRSSVRLAIQAPREITIDRDEIWRRNNPGAATPLEQAEQQRATKFQGGSPGGAGGPPRPMGPTPGDFHASGHDEHSDRMDP